MSSLQRTVFYDHHVALGAKMVEFAGWEIPVFYFTGIVQEHLSTRKAVGLFDVSHMGRFTLRGVGALKFLQQVLTNNAEALHTRRMGAQYRLIPSDTGRAIDDAYLYRFIEQGYLLVVNAANREEDRNHFQKLLRDFDGVELIDHAHEIIMLAVQGPRSRELLDGIIQSGTLPEPMRNAVSIVTISGAPVKVARTGYTGVPLCFELFASKDDGLMLWDHIVAIWEQSFSI